jgi:hypothetical protein
MARYEVGERVERKCDKREGVVREVEEGFVSGSSCLIKWNDGGKDWENEDSLLPR